LIEVQRTDFVSVPTRDRERAAKFYGEILGIVKNPSSHESFPEFETGNLTLSIVSPEEIGLEFQPLPFGTIVLRVRDVAAARKELEAAGIEFERETMDSGVCHMAFFRDPDGNGLMIHHRYAPYADGRSPDEQA
jgi:catechol 2,3-dioxygenase-like lactoylglutathione lyase family enzyme